MLVLLLFTVANGSVDSPSDDPVAARAYYARMISKLWTLSHRRGLPQTTLDEARAELSACNDWRVSEAVLKLLPNLGHPSQLALDRFISRAFHHASEADEFFIGGEPGLLYLAREGSE